MSDTPWGVLAAAITRLSDRLDGAPTFREATVAATSPLSVLFDTDTDPTLVTGSLSGDIAAGDRVMTLKLRHFIWVVGSRSTVGLETIRRIRLTSTTDLSRSSTDHAFQIGTDTGLNLGIDQNEILALSNGFVSPIHINVEPNVAGDVNQVNIGASDHSGTINARGAVTLGPAAPTTASAVLIPGSTIHRNLKRAASTTLTTGVWTQFTTGWTDDTVNLNMGYSAGKFVVPVDGVYLISGSLAHAAGNTAGQRLFRFEFSDGFMPQSPAFTPYSTTQVPTPTLVLARRMAAGDTVLMSAFQNGAATAAVTVGDNSYFTITLLTRL